MLKQACFWGVGGRLWLMRLLLVVMAFMDDLCYYGGVHFDDLRVVVLHLVYQITRVKYLPKE